MTKLVGAGGRAIARYRAHGTVRGNVANAAATLIQHIQAAVPRPSKGTNTVELRLQRRTTVTRKARAVAARQRRDRARGGDALDRMGLLIPRAD